jgi:predicted 3-demethylubiquinone-9 3-methyltransferase (glyoxalase superfamily)
MKKIIPFLWFNHQAEQAARHYVSVFKNSKITDISRDGKKVFSVSFTLDGQKFIAFNGGPLFKFTPALSLFVDCKDQREVDHYWKKLSQGGTPGRCGWLTDKFGVSWQVIPKALGDLMSDEDQEKSGRVFDAMMKMDKIDVKKLQAAHKGR